MKNMWYLIVFTFLFGCAGSPTRTAFEAEKHRMDMMDLKTNMSMEEVRDRMGVPKKIERRAMNGIEYEIWYYMTTGINFDQTRLIDDNFTPFVFYGTCLRGWGWKFYNHLFDINNARFKKEEDRSGCGTQLNGNRHSYEHKIITPFKDEKKEALEETLEEFIKSAAEDKSQPLNKNIPKTAETPDNIPSATGRPANNGIENFDKSKKNLPGEGLEVILKPVEKGGVPTGQTVPIITREKTVEEPLKPDGQSSGTPYIPKTPSTTSSQPVPGINPTDSTNVLTPPSFTPEQTNNGTVPSINSEGNALNSPRENEIVPEVKLPPKPTNTTEEPTPQKFNWW